MAKIQNEKRKNVKDIWNAFMVDGADFSLSDYYEAR